MDYLTVLHKGICTYIQRHMHLCTKTHANTKSHFNITDLYVELSHFLSSRTGLKGSGEGAIGLEGGLSET